MQGEVACEQGYKKAWSERRGLELTDPVTTQLFLTTNLAARTAEEITKTHSTCKQIFLDYRTI